MATPNRPNVLYCCLPTISASTRSAPWATTSSPPTSTCSYSEGQHCGHIMGGSCGRRLHAKPGYADTGRTLYHLEAQANRSPEPRTPGRSAPGAGYRPSEQASGIMAPRRMRAASPRAPRSSSAGWMTIGMCPPATSTPRVGTITLAPRSRPVCVEYTVQPSRRSHQARQAFIGTVRRCRRLVSRAL